MKNSVKLLLVLVIILLVIIGFKYSLKKEVVIEEPLNSETTSIAQQSEEYPGAADFLNSEGEQPGEKFTVKGLNFQLPTPLTVNRIEGSTVWISTPDPKYTVAVPMRINEVSGYPSEFFSGPYSKIVPSGAIVGGDACAPAIACYAISYKGKQYSVMFGLPESNEKKPTDYSEDEDGLWSPSTTFTRTQEAFIMTSVR